MYDVAKKYSEPMDRVLANSVLAPCPNPRLNEPCWEWIGARRANRRGVFYGKLNVRIQGKHLSVAAHRFAWWAAKGRRPRRNGVVAHLCDNSLCVNPAHLVCTSQSKNMSDCVRRLRHNSNKSKQ